MAAPCWRGKKEHMKLAWSHVVSFVVMGCGIALAQQPSNGSSAMLAYENGRIENSVYTNECFGFSFAIPDGWHIITQALGNDAKGIHTGKGALVLLMLDQKKEGSLGNAITLNTFDASIYDKTVRELVSRYARVYVNADRDYREIARDTYSVEYAGRTFSRADIKHTMRGGSVLYEAFVYTKFREYYIGGFLSAGTPEGLELAAKSLQGISFHEDEPNPKCVMRGGDNTSAVGIMGGVISSEPPQPDSGQLQRVRVSQVVSAGLLVKKVQPQYPANAKDARIQGQVVLQAEIDKDGNIESLSLISGHPMLAPAAIEAVKQWKYKPYLLNGQPVKVETQIVVTFSLSGS
jgi:TonB family protein